jgi:hypothetical protein
VEDEGEVWEREKEKKREWVCWGDAPTLPLLLLHNMSSWLNTGNPCTEGTSLRLVLVYALYDIYPIIRNDLACHILSTEQTSFDLLSTSIDTLKAIVAIVLGFPIRYKLEAVKLPLSADVRLDIWIFRSVHHQTYSTVYEDKKPSVERQLDEACTGA